MYPARRETKLLSVISTPYNNECSIFDKLQREKRQALEPCLTDRLSVPSASVRVIVAGLSSWIFFNSACNAECLFSKHVTALL